MAGHVRPLDLARRPTPPFPSAVERRGRALELPLSSSSGAKAFLLHMRSMVRWCAASSIFLFINAIRPLVFKKAPSYFLSFCRFPPCQPTAHVTALGPKMSPRLCFPLFRASLRWALLRSLLYKRLCTRPPHTNARGPEAVRGGGYPMGGVGIKIKRNSHLIQID